MAASALALAACTHTGAASMSAIKSYRAEDFFLGRKLEIARALEAGDVAKARKLAPGVDLAAPADRDMTLMVFFMLPGTKSYPNYAAVRELVALGVDPDKQIIEGMGSALYYTFIERKDPADQTGVLFFKAMLDGGLAPNSMDEDGTALLLRAASDGRLEHVKLLVERGADVNVKSKYVGKTALSHAIAAVQPGAAIYLVQHGARIDSEAFDNNGVTPSWAVSLRLKRIRREHPLHAQFEQLRDLMIAKGAKWPPDPPDVVRERMRAQGLQPAVPPGHQR